MMQCRRNLSGLPAQGAFSLIEVLVAVVVLSIGILGIAGLQVRAVQQNTQTYTRTQATILAQNMADRMRANFVLDVDGIKSYTATRVNYSQTNLTDSDFEKEFDPAENPPADCFGARCNPATLANWDQFYWSQALTDPQNIPTGGVGCITCAAGAPGACYANANANPCRINAPPAGSCRVTVLWQQVDFNHPRANARTGMVEHCVEIGFQL